jgi:hypothetical protein
MSPSVAFLQSCFVALSFFGAIAHQFFECFAGLAGPPL